MDVRDEFKRIIDERVTRPGIENLMDWIERTDFFTAPASTRYHGAFEGGLVLHSLNVYSQLKNLCKFYGCESSQESIAIVSLFHDICKIGCYKIQMRWRKDENQKWEQYPCYTFNEDFSFGGHGAKSVYLLQHYIMLTPEEASAINSHMGQWDATTYSNPTAVYEKNLLAWLLHVADEAASYVVKNEKED